MFKRDDQIISKLYESIYNVDYFSLDEKEFDLKAFLSGQSMFFKLDEINPELDCLLESFEKISSAAPTKHGNEDVYEITLRNGLKFKLHLNYIAPKKTKEFLHTKQTSAAFKNDNELASSYKQLVDNIQDEDTICMIMFKDEEDHTHITGKVGMSARELFVALKNALIDSWSTKKVDHIRAIGMRVSIQETKRKDFYEMLITTFLTHKFPNTFTDDTTEKQQGFKLLFATN